MSYAAMPRYSRCQGTHCCCHLSRRDYSGRSPFDARPSVGILGSLPPQPPGVLLLRLLPQAAGGTRTRMVLTGGQVPRPSAKAACFTAEASGRYRTDVAGLRNRSSAIELQRRHKPPRCRTSLVRFWRPDCPPGRGLSGCCGLLLPRKTREAGTSSGPASRKT